MMYHTTGSGAVVAMGYAARRSDLIGFASPVGEPDDGAAERQVEVARSWAGLTSRGRILVSVEQLARGRDVGMLLAHESAHDVLLQGSVFGLQQLALSTFGMPPWPPGAVRRTARRCLALTAAASTTVQEGCATFLPSLHLSGTELEAYWAAAPDDYRRFAAPLEWIRGRDLAAEAMRRLVFAIGDVALGVRIPAPLLDDPRGLRAFLEAAETCPDQRFARAAGALADAPDGALDELAASGDADRRIASDWCPQLTVEPALASGAEWFPAWERVVADMTGAWLANARVAEEERGQLRDAAQQPVLLAPTPGPSVLKAVLMQTVSAKGAVWDEPPVERLLPYELVELSYNGSGGEVPGIENVDGTGLPLASGQAALWLSGPGRHNAAARLSEAGLRAYLDRADPDTTICVDDALYLFEWGDVLAAAPLLRGRPHLVLVRQQTPIGLLARLRASTEFAGDPELRYTAIGGDTPGVSYLVLRPGSRPYPLVVAPVPSPTAERVLRELAGSTDGPRWVAQDPQELLFSDRETGRHAVRLFASYEGKPWPGVVRRAGAPADPLGLGPPPDSRARGGDAVERLDPDLRRLLDAGGALESAGQPDAAAELYERMTTLDTPVAVGTGAVALGMLRSSRGDARGAAEAYRTAARSGDPDLAPLGLLYLGQALLAVGDLNGAASAFHEAARSGHPDHAPPAAWLFAQMASLVGWGGAAGDLYRWVVASGHPDVGPRAAAALAELEG